jgi:hypothetical protein
VTVRSFTDGEGAQWTVWAVRPETRERRLGAERRSGRDRREEAAARLAALPAERRATSDRRAASERRLTPRSRAVIIPAFEQGWLCFEANRERRRLAPIPPDWEGCDLATLAAYHRRAALSRPSSRSA